MSGTRNSSAYMLMFPSLCSWSFWRERDLLLLLLDLEHLDDEELLGGVLAALDHEARDDLRALHVAALLLDELDALAADRQRVLLDHSNHLVTKLCFVVSPAAIENSVEHDDSIGYAFCLNSAENIESFVNLPDSAIALRNH